MTSSKKIPLSLEKRCIFVKSHWLVKLTHNLSQGNTIRQCIKNSYEAIELALEDLNDRKKFGIPQKVKVEFIIEGSTINVG